MNVQGYIPSPEHQLWGDINNNSKIINRNLDAYTCGEDQFCKNLDLFNSERGNLVYKCPNAICSLGECECGPECIKDERTNICVPPSDTPYPSYNPGTLPPPITSAPLSNSPIPLPTQEILTNRPNGTLPPPITSAPLSSAPIPMPTQEILTNRPNGTLPPPITRAPLSNSPIPLPTQEVLTNRPNGTLPPPITSAPLSSAPIPLPTQEVLTNRPNGTLPPSIETNPTWAPIPMPTQPSIYPIPTPPLNKCTLAQLDKENWVCWKREEQCENGVCNEFIIDCDAGFCDLNNSKVKGTAKLAGTNITIYGNKYNEDSNPPELSPESSPESSPEEDLDNDPLFIIALIFGGITILLLGYYLLNKLNKTPKGGRKSGGRKSGRRKSGGRRFG